MKLFGYEFRKISKKEISQVSAYGGTGLIQLASREYPMLLSTVYRCVDLISDSVAVLPLEVFRLDEAGFKMKDTKHPIYELLDLEPNENMTRYVFIKTLMASVLLTGNGYAYIERGEDGVTPIQLVYIPSNQVSIQWIVDKEGIRRKRYLVSGFTQLVEPCDMIHVLNFSYDGIIGVSTLTHARQTLGIATSSEEHAAGFFKSGAAVSGVLTIEGARLTKEQKEQNYKQWEERSNSNNGRPGGIVILEGNMKYTPISISPKDSQLLESRQFNVVDICRFFSVSPVKAFDLSKSSYSTIEATQLEYLTDTALPVITKIEQEINRKVFSRAERSMYKAEFNTSAILRADKAAQGAFWKDMANVGAATPNEIRREIGMSRIENGDEAFVQVNVMTLKNAVKEKIIEGNQE